MRDEPKAGLLRRLEPSESTLNLFFSTYNEREVQRIALLRPTQRICSFPRMTREKPKG